ncbi:SLC13 family permease [Paucidesulfovibrio longus]|uniref:SLC13 family permease n=1 Tax=Paucidesulfovibrio longus TaxID=889 RepID=UPI0003B620DF|nr:SLC13 family permease [Paucidesulfovibrio longus]
MERFADMAAYLWGRLPLILLFANAYLAYRLLAVTGLTTAFVRRVLWLAGGPRGRGGLPGLLLLLMLAAALLSFFIPNAVTMLTLLPALTELERELREKTGAHMATPLALAAIYGANIGGMGSLVGSPANLLFIGAVDFFNVPGREQIGFANWFFWSLPLVALFLLAGWTLLALFALPRGVRLTPGDIPEPRELTPWQRSGGALFVLFLCFWTASSVASEVWPSWHRLEPAVAAGFFCWFVFLAFFRAGTPCQGTSAPLLRLREVFSGLPRRGLLFLGLLGLLALAVKAFHLDTASVAWLKGLDSQAAPRFAVIFCMVLAVILLTELLSNTVVSAAFFPVAYAVAQAHGISPLALMLAVSLASTCAFMTPVATPCNALAFGEMRGVSLRRMLGLGLVLNLAGAVLMSVWVAWVIPLVYSWGGHP